MFWALLKFLQEDGEFDTLEWDGTEALLSGLKVDTKFCVREFLPTSSTRKLLEQVEEFSYVNNFGPYKITVR